MLAMKTELPEDRIQVIFVFKIVCFSFIINDRLIRKIRIGSKMKYFIPKNVCLTSTFFLNILSVYET